MPMRTSKIKPKAEEEDDERASTATERLKEAAERMEKLKSSRRRSYRLVCFFVIAGFLTFVWFMAVLPHTQVVASKTFADGGEFEIELTSCDLDFVPSPPGTEHTIQYGAAWKSYDVQWINSATDANTPVAAKFGNAAGCSMQPLSRCRAICLVTVTVPTDSTVSFQVAQGDLAEGGVATFPEITVTPGTELQDLAVGEWFSREEALNVNVDHATIRGSLTTYMVSGDLRTMGATLGSVWADSSGTGSIYLLDVPAAESDVSFSYRQPNGKVCLATDLGPDEATFVPADPWVNCDIVTSIDEGTDDGYFVMWTRGQYDKDSDGRVTKEEFQTGLGEMRCCGGSCPFSSWCEAEAQDMGYTENTKVRFNEFATRLAATDQTAWVPYCKANVDLGLGHQHGSTSLPNLKSEHGEVAVTLRQGGAGADVPTVDADGVATTFHVDRNASFAPGSSLPGYQLPQAEATHLQSTYAEAYASVDATDPLYLVLDVVGGAGHPPVRFLYVTNVAFLAVDPAHLTFLTAGLLTPPVKRERVHFLDGSCRLDAAALDSATYNTTVAEMHAQLHKALQESAFADDVLRGALVLVGNRTTSQWGSMELFGFDDDGQIFPWSNRVVQTGMNTAIIISTTVGALVGLGFVLGLVRVLAYIQRGYYQKAVAARKTVLTKMGLDPKVEMEKDMKRGGEDAQRPNWNPFLFPFKLLTTLFIMPLRSKIVNSVAKFTRERCAKVAHPKTEEEKKLWEHGPFLYMRTFCREYELFCLANDLRLVEDRDEIQRTLISQFNVRVQQLTVRRIYGLRWLAEGEKPDPDTPPMAFPRIEAKPSAPPPPAQDYAVGAAAAGVGGGAPSPPPAVKRNKPLEYETLQQFVLERCVVDQTPGSFLDFETRGDPLGGTRVGFRPEVFDHFKAKGLPMPDLRGDEWAKHALPKKVRFRDRCKVRQVRGLKWDLEAESLALSWKWYLVEGMAVLLHMCVAFVPAMLLIFYALAMQHTWGVLMCPVGGIDGKQPLLWNDVVFFSESDMTLPGATEPRYSLLLLRLIVWESIAFMILSAARLLLNYAQAPKWAVFNAMRWAYSLVVFLHLMWTFSYLGVIASWLLLAAILEPSRFLPTGMAVVVVVTVGVTVGREMLAAAAKLKEKLYKAFQLALQAKMKAAMEKIEQQIYEEMLAKQGGLAAVSDEEEEAVAKRREEAKEEDVTPLDIFMAINTDGTDTLKMDEFKKLFDVLELDITENQKENLFAFCDVDCSGDISEKEFQEGWEMMVEVFLENSADSQGLSKAQILLAVCYILVTLGMLIAFVLIAIQSWQNEGSFNAVVQSALISGMGKASASLRSRSKGELSDPDDLVGSIMSEQKEAVSGE